MDRRTFLRAATAGAATAGTATGLVVTSPEHAASAAVRPPDGAPLGTSSSGGAAAGLPASNTTFQLPSGCFRHTELNVPHASVVSPSSFLLTIL